MYIFVAITVANDVGFHLKQNSTGLTLKTEWYRQTDKQTETERENALNLLFFFIFLFSFIFLVHDFFNTCSVHTKDTFSIKCFNNLHVYWATSSQLP